MILVRHGRTAANAEGVLAGRTPGVALDDAGRAQAEQVAARLAGLPVAVIATSPLMRTIQTARVIAGSHRPPMKIRRDKALIECGYGEWAGRPIKTLAKTRLWKTVQEQPSAVVFPGGESLLDMQRRAVSGVRRMDAEVGASRGDDACWVAVSHGDVIKSILADALGMHLDMFQRIVVHPASVSVVRYTDRRPLVLHVNDDGADLSALRPRSRKRQAGSGGDAVVGGGDGNP